MGAVISILMKKAQVVLEVRAENNLLENRILDIVRQEKGETEVDDIEKEDSEEVRKNRCTDYAFAKAESEVEPLKRKVSKPEPTIRRYRSQKKSMMTYPS